MKRCLVFVIVVLLAAPWAAAGGPASAREWLEGPRKWLLTPAERAELEGISSAEELERFAELFWARRDPDLTTRVNEFQLDFQARVAAADAQFGEDGLRGALTDRGKTLILLGKPAKRWTESIQSFLSRLAGSSAGAFPGTASQAQAIMPGASYDPYKGKADIWVYAREQLPEGAELPRRVDSVMFVFLDYEGKNHWVLERKFRQSRYAVKALEVAPQALVHHPDLTEPPVYPLLSGVPTATEAQLAWLAVEPAPWPEGAVAVAGRGVATAEILPYWVFVRLPEGTPADLAVGRMTAADGTVLGSFQKPVTGLATALGTVYELAVPAPEGPGTLELALASGGTPVAVRRFELEPEAVPGEGTWMTPVYAGAEVLQQPEFDAGTPFVFGGYHVILRPEGRYTRRDTVNYFCLVVRPGLGEDGAPHAKVRLAVYQDGKRLTGTPYREVTLSAVEPDVYMFGSQLPLEVFRAGGTFTLKVWLKDTVSGTERATELPLVLE